MSKKLRLIILLSCVGLFLIIAPILVSYSMGYRFDLETKKIVATGGIYVQTSPTLEEVIIDSRASKKPRLFTNDVFVQSLLPKEHTVLVTKEGYYSYYKDVFVEENQVTKLENILLFKKNIAFDILNLEENEPSPFDQKSEYFIDNNDLYQTVEANQEIKKVTPSPIIKDVIVFTQKDNNIIWIGKDGFIYKSNIDNLLEKDSEKTPVQLILEPLTIVKTGNYKIIINEKNFFIIDNGKILLLNSQDNTLKDFYDSAKDLKISPDHKNVVYFDDNHVRVTPLDKNLLEIQENEFIYDPTEKILDSIWLNNYYIIVATPDRISILEIDARGKINIVNFPEIIKVEDQNINLHNPEILFDHNERKLYILNAETILISERLIP